MNPISRERLEKTLARVAREHGLDQERLRRWVSFLALCGVLERAIHEDILNRYYLKGGVAMELRFAEAARATKDLDLGLDGDRAYRLSSFATALQLGFDEFTFRLRPQTHHMELADTVRIEVAILYKTRGWQTVDVDLGPPGAENADLVNPAIIGLAEMGLPVTTPVRCLNLSEQVAQKLHACTGPASAGRARDVLDILLIDSLGKLDYAQTRVAVEKVFRERATHQLPRTFELPVAWQLELESLASSLHSPIKSANQIALKFQSILAQIASQHTE
ncbi:MAG TPA: nucleotidyl transferase AbiEii/AbiGii toxin family protein [Terracidiphilus sp.]|nr:nucleotidyl transferase AbiEii/AbiGii toxin family protein [Terracidiphilus sp.]